jgi:hypothetical protein
MDPEQLSLANICGGAVEEVFQRELDAVLSNIADINTNPEQKRKIALEFTLKPFEDRSGCQIEFSCKSKTSPVNTVKGTMFLQRRGTGMIAIAHDPKQARLFDHKSAAAGDRVS